MTILTNKEFRRAILINNYLFPFLAIITTFFLVSEIYFYQGFIGKHLLIDSSVWLYLTSASVILILYNNKKNSKGKIFFVHHLISKIAIFIILPVLLLWFALNLLENIHYPNYIFSTLHLQPQNFSALIQTLLVISMPIVWPFLIKNDQLLKGIKLKITLRTLPNLLAGIFLFIYVYQSGIKTINKAFDSSIYILTHLNDSYDKKMEKQWGLFYDYMVFLRNHTEENATIVIPPKESPWLSTGNLYLVRSFLYPRTLIQGQYDKLPDTSFDYILLAKGEWTTKDLPRYGWPKVPLTTNKIWYFYPETKNVIEYIGNYNPSDSQNMASWGLIKINKL